MPDQPDPPPPSDSPSPGLPRPQAWALALSWIFALSRLIRFRWCGPEDATADAVMSRVADAAAVFAATRLGFGSAGGSGRSAKDRFGPGPIEP